MRTYPRRAALKALSAAALAASAGLCCRVAPPPHTRGFERIPTDLANYLKLLQALKAKSKPCGFALGNAVGDSNAWCHWVVWAHGGKMVDDHNKVVINSKETLAALDYARAMYQTFVDGTLSWLDPNNNKAFLSGEISLTLNGISIYYAAKNCKIPRCVRWRKTSITRPCRSGRSGGRRSSIPSAPASS